MVLAGCDEAGCGPAFGDLVAGTVVLPDNYCIEGLADSKKLSERKRKVLFEQIKNEAKYGIGRVTSSEIDEKGLAWARREVFHRALDNLVDTFQCIPTEIIVDGTIYKQWRDIKYKCIPKADTLIPEVSAASIIAKVTRDSEIEAMCDADPTLDEHYDIRSNKGYLSARHKDGLRKHGFTNLHRHSYNIKL